MGPKLMICCKPEEMGTKKFGRMLIEGEKKRITRKEHQRLLNKFEMEGLVAQKKKDCGTWHRRKS